MPQITNPSQIDSVTSDGQVSATTTVTIDQLEQAVTNAEKALEQAQNQAQPFLENIATAQTVVDSAKAVLATAQTMQQASVEAQAPDTTPADPAPETTSTDVPADVVPADTTVTAPDQTQIAPDTTTSTDATLPIPDATVATDPAVALGAPVDTAQA